MTKILSISSAKSSQTLAQGTFDNENLKFLDIERWNLESSFFESLYFLALIFCDFQAKQ